MDRRVFFGTLAVVSIWVSFRGARRILLQGAIGRVAYCRTATEEWLRLARKICAEPALIVEVDPAGVPAQSGAVFLGSEATLVVGPAEWRVLR
ncbi:MAG TPA: hypothetical protein VH640_00200 [Bryobacteraceae bacterium]|jgi:hypothetical protein